MVIYPWLAELGLPDELVSKGSDVQAILDHYFRAAKEGRRQLNEAKLLVVGAEAVGKTSLVRYVITNEPRNPSEAKTAGHGLVGQTQVGARPQQDVRTALVHQRVGPEARGHLGAARLAHELDVVHVGGAVEPLIGAWQGGGELCRIESKAGRGVAVETVGHFLKPWGDTLPVFERYLKGVGELRNKVSALEITAYDDEVSIGASA